jgi:ATP-binding cassette subfamily F protein 3
VEKTTLNLTIDMIQVENLSISFSGDIVFEDASFAIHPKERCSLVGRNGSGKTTLFRLLIGQEKPDSGSVTFSKGYRIGYLDQHIRFSRPSVIEEAALGLPEEERDQVYRAEKILAGLGFKEEDFDKAPDQLSGGYHLRLHLAKVLLSEPDCLLLDEPTNYLDILSIRFLTPFLQQWKKELVVISHDREFLDNIATHTLGIHRNKVRKVKGNTESFFQQIVLEEEVHERTRVKEGKKREHLQSYIERFGAKASKASQAQSKLKMLHRIPVLEALKDLYQLNFHFHQHPFSGKKMLEAKNLSFGYEKTKPLIRDVSLVIEPRDRIAIIGKNGYGKSTLLRLLTRELTAHSGDIVASEQTAIGYFGQTHIQRLHSNRTIEEEIADANTLLSFSAVKRICGQMMFSGDSAKKRIGVLSGGEKSRVLLGKILAHPCNLLMLDEPTHHLDIESIEALIDALEDFEGAVLIVTHSELILKRLQLSKMILCHAQSQEFFLGDYEEFLEKRGWEEESPSVKSKPSGDYADDKRKRAESVAARSKALKPLEQEMQRVEAAIFALEKVQEEEQQQLIAASEASNTPSLQMLLKKSAERQKEIDSLYQKHAQLSTEYEKKKGEFS